MGETVALQNTTILNGTVRVDVMWGTPADLTPNTTALGQMSLTISGLASAVGDPLSNGGTTHTDANPSAGSEIADIVFPGMSIIVGAAGDFANNMVVGTAGSPVDEKTPYSEAAVTGVRYRQTAAAADIIATPTTASAKALFVGQGVDGPLGVIGTWTLVDTAVGRVAPDGSHTDDIGQAIYGAFGAEIP